MRRSTQRKQVLDFYRSVAVKATNYCFPQNYKQYFIACQYKKQYFIDNIFIGVKKMLKLQEIREEKNILQKELAEKLQKTRACISSWETNKTEPDLQSLIGLADILEVTTDYLLGRTNDVGLIEVHNQLTQDQQELLSLYNRMSFQDKNQLIGFAKALVY